MRYLLDSVILIDHFNGIDAASEFIVAHGTNCLISAITRAEVMAGFEAESSRDARLLLDIFPIIPISKEEADRAAALRREHRWKLPDALQAAVATLHGLKLVTRNTKDFPVTKHRFVVVPYHLVPD